MPGLTVKYVRHILYLICVFCTTTSQTMASSTVENETVATKSAVMLTTEEQSWVRDHPVVRARVSNAPPYHFWDNGPKGISVELLNRIAELTGLRVEYKHDISWSDAIENIRNHVELDLLLTATHSLEREAFMAFSEDYLKLPWVIFTRKDGQYNIFALEDLFNLTIAVEKGFLLQKRLAKDFPQIKQLLVADAAEALRAVSENQADAYVGNLTMAQYSIVHLGLNNLQVAAPADLGYSNMAFAIRGDWPQLGSIIDKGLATITPEEQSAINRKYFTVEVDYGINLFQVAGWIAGILVASSMVIIFIVVRGNRLLRHEIIKRKQKEKQLILNESVLTKSLENEQQSKSFYRQLFDHSSSGVAVYEAVDNGQDFVFKDFNKAGEKIDNVSREKLLGRRVTEAFPGIKDFGLLGVFRQVWQTGEPTLYPMSCYKKGSIKEWRENRVYKLPTGEIVAVYDDITKQKQLEAEKQVTEIRLQQAQKMEAVGSLASGVAHDLNNILSGVIGYPELLLQTLPKESELREPLEAIHDSGQRAAIVVADLLTVARGAASIREIHNLNILIEEYLISPECKKLKSLYPEVLFQSTFEAIDPTISCSPVHVKKCLMNLVTNAAEAVGKDGTVMVSTHNKYIDNAVGSKQQMETGEYIVINVQDTGSGISDTDLGHIFEPFYSTKTMGRSGTGLGLAIVWNTMLDHNGKVLIDSSEQGTRFQLYFPRNEHKVIEQAEKDKTEGLTGNNEHILVVDDEPQVRNLASQMLKTMGYKIDSVCSGELAIKFVKDNPVDLVVMDMMMEPGMNGCQAYREILKLYPGQKAVIASGFSESDDIKAALELGAGGFIKKPYSMTKLGRVVRDALNN